MVDQYKAVTREIEFEADAKKLSGHRTRYSSWPASSSVRCTGGGPRQGRAGHLQPTRQGEETRARLDRDLRRESQDHHNHAEGPPEQVEVQHLPLQGTAPPISAPGKAALEAAANPEKGKWLYFVTVNLDTGETKFAREADGLREDPSGVPEPVPVPPWPM